MDGRAPGTGPDAAAATTWFGMAQQNDYGRRAKEACVVAAALARVAARRTERVLGPLLKSGLEAARAAAENGRVAAARQVRRSRRHGLLKKRRNRRIAAAVLLIGVAAAAWLVLSIVSSVFGAAMAFIGLTASPATVLELRASAGSRGGLFTANGDEATFGGDARARAKEQARLQALLNDRVEERVEERLQAIHADFSHFERDQALSESDEQRKVKQDVEKRQRRSRDKRAKLVAALREGHKFLLVEQHVAAAPAEQQLNRRRRHRRSSRHDEGAAESEAGGDAGPTASLAAALEQLGYGQATSPAEHGLTWLVAPHLECEGEAVKAALNQIPDISGLVAFCHGDPQWVGHLGRKDVLDQRLQWLDVKLHRLDNCITYADFVLPTFLVNPATDLVALQRRLAEEEGLGAGTSFILKHQRMPSELQRQAAAALPLVTTTPVKAIKAVRKRGHDMEGLVIQPLKSNPLLWDGRKFTLRSWALVLSSSPLIALYHDGVVLRSLDRARAGTYSGKSGSRTSSARHSHSAGADLDQLANITTRQRDHPAFAARRAEAFGCMDDLQAYLAGVYKTTEMAHYTDLVLRPYLKRLVLFAIAALRREHKHDSPVWAIQHICFDFMIDSNWHVWMLDASAECPTQVGGPEYASPCKRATIDALGVQAAKIAEQLLAGKQLGNHTSASKGGSWLEGVDIGSFEVLVDETVQGDPGQKSRVEEQICRRAAYQDFRERQTFSKHVAQAVLPADGRPRFKTDAELGLSRDATLGPWKCPVCGYLNGAKATVCDQCGGAEHEPAGHPEHGDPGDRETGFVHPGAASGLADASVGPSSASQGGGSPNFGIQGEFESAFGRDGVAWDRTGFGAARGPAGGVASQKRAVDVRVDMCAGKKFDIKEPVEIVGHDIEPLRTSTHHACCSACAVNAACRGFTYVAETFQCWIKSDIGSEGHHDGMVSGVLHDPSMSQGPARAGSFPGAFGSSGASNAGFSGVALARPSPAEQRMAQGARVQEVHHSSDGARREYYRKQLTEIFAAHDPNKITKVDVLLDRYRGNEERFVQRTIKQYETIDRLVQERNAARNNGGGRPELRNGAVPHAPARDSHGLSRADYRERLVEILQQGDPAKLADVEAMLDRFQGKEMQLVQYLLSKYRPG